MPPHLRPLVRGCHQEGCDRDATEALYSTFNHHVGDYCRPHAAARLEAALRQDANDRRCAMEARARATPGGSFPADPYGGKVGPDPRRTDA